MISTVCNTRTQAVKLLSGVPTSNIKSDLTVSHVVLCNTSGILAVKFLGHLCSLIAPEQVSCAELCRGAKSPRQMHLSSLVVLHPCRWKLAEATLQGTWLTRRASIQISRQLLWKNKNNAPCLTFQVRFRISVRVKECSAMWDVWQSMQWFWSEGSECRSVHVLLIASCYCHLHLRKKLHCTTVLKQGLLLTWFSH